MAAWRLITVRPNLYSRHGGELRCKRCGEKLSIGDKTWAHMCPRKHLSYTEYYCVICFSKLWV